MYMTVSSFVVVNRIHNHIHYVERKKFQVKKLLRERMNEVNPIE